jgi:large subunit ribosomal protein L1
MGRNGKQYDAAKARVESRVYSLEDAIPLVQSIRFAKFDESIEMAMRLGVNPRHADQMVRGTVVLPHGLGRSKHVVVIAGPDGQKEAEEAGADTVQLYTALIYQGPALVADICKGLRDCPPERNA